MRDSNITYRDKIKKVYILLIAGFVFLVNPYYELYDFLPDFIGYAMLVYALTDIAEAFPYFKEARDGFKKLIAISVSRIPFILLINWIKNEHANEMTLSTVITFAYVIIELVVTIPTIVNLFRGCIYFEERIEFSSEIKIPFNKSSSFVRGISIAFFCAKSLFSLIPALMLVPISDLGEHTYSQYYKITLIASSVIVIIFAVVWLFFLSGYIIGIYKNGEITKFAVEKLELENETVATNRKIANLFVILNLLSAAVGLNIDFIIDDMNVLPDIISALTFLFLCVCVYKFFSTRELRGLSATCIVYLVASTISCIVTNLFLAKYDYKAIAKLDAAANAYIKIIISHAVETVAFILFLFFLRHFILKLVCSNTGYGHNDKLTRELHKSFKRKFNIFLIFGIIYALSSLLNTYLMSFSKTVLADKAYVESGKVTLPMFDWYWIIPIAISIAWLIYTFVIIDNVKEEILLKYDRK